MADARTYPHGVPCWIDTEQPDPEAACHFYGSLFGWTFEDAVPPGAPGSYLIAQLEGKDVAAIAPSSTEAPVAWSTYIAVDDADSVVERITSSGGRVISPPQDAGPGGRAATFADPDDATFRVWQARRRLGAQTVNAPSSWNFSDLHTTDPDAAQVFYGDVFGWQADDLGIGSGASMLWRRPGYGDHLAATIDPDIHARQAAVAAPPGFADAVAWLASVEQGELSHWHVTFAVDDRDRMVEAALRLGATIDSGPIDTAWTRTAVLRDPQGAVFTLSQFAPPTP